MSITAASLKDNLIDELKDHDKADSAAYNKLVEQFVETRWLLHADKDEVAPRLRYAYTKRDVIDALLGQTWQQVDEEIGVPFGKQITAKVSQKFGNLLRMRDLAHAEITAIVGGVGAARRGGAIGVMTATAPRELPTGQTIDANHSRYRGDPYERSRY